MGNEKAGCLPSFLRFLAVSDEKQGKRKPDRVIEGPAFALVEHFLSPAELSFYLVLMQVVGGKYQICPKVRLIDLFKGADQAARNSINKSHVDFVVCDPKTMKPLLAIELDDASHNRDRRKARDSFVDEVFMCAGLRLVRFPCRKGYVLTEVAAALKAK